MLDERRRRARRRRSLRRLDRPRIFTGLRVGIATIQGLALATRQASGPVSAFDALRLAGACRREPVATWIDAHRGEVFAALFSPDAIALRALVGHSSCDARRVVDRARQGERDPVRRRAARSAINRILGSGLALGRSWRRMPPLLAGAIAEIAATDPSRARAPHALAPLYVRRPTPSCPRPRGTEINTCRSSA